METALLIGTTIVGGGGILMICIVVWKIVTGDSRPANEREVTAGGAQVPPRSGQIAHVRTNPMTPSGALEQEMAPVYFIPELGSWSNTAERDKAASDLVEIKKRRREAK